ncbi:MAG: response regulator [Patescibacteria group bacterium]|nr:response regulator [Patescibacteria group bacterium]
MAKLVLLIEDDLDIQKVFSEKLKSKGFEVLLAIDASHAFHILQEKTPSIILLDIMLPGSMNGFDFLEKIKSNPKWQGIPVLVLTNLDTERDLALKAGATDYLIKANTDVEIIAQKVIQLTS